MGEKDLEYMRLSELLNIDGKTVVIHHCGIICRKWLAWEPMELRSM